MGSRRDIRSRAACAECPSCWRMFPCRLLVQAPDRAAIPRRHDPCIAVRPASGCTGAGRRGDRPRCLRDPFDPLPAKAMPAHHINDDNPIPQSTAQRWPCIPMPQDTHILQYARSPEAPLSPRSAAKLEPPANLAPVDSRPRLRHPLPYLPEHQTYPSPRI